MRRWMDKDEKCLTDTEAEELLLELEQIIAKVRAKQLFITSGDVVASLRYSTELTMSLSREKPYSQAINEDDIAKQEDSFGRSPMILRCNRQVDPPLPPIVDPNPVPTKISAIPPGPAPIKKYLRSDADALLVTLNEVGADPVALGGVCHFASEQACIWIFGPIILEQNLWIDDNGDHVEWTEDLDTSWDKDVLHSARLAAGQLELSGN